MIDYLASGQIWTKTSDTFYTYLIVRNNTEFWAVKVGFWEIVGPTTIEQMSQNHECVGNFFDVFVSKSGVDYLLGKVFGALKKDFSDLMTDKVFETLVDENPKKG